MGVPDDGYSINASCALNNISTFLLHFCLNKNRVIYNMYSVILYHFKDTQYETY